MIFLTLKVYTVTYQYYMLHSHVMLLNIKFHPFISKRKEAYNIINISFNLNLKIIFTPSEWVIISGNSPGCTIFSSKFKSSITLYCSDKSVLLQVSIEQILDIQTRANHRFKFAHVWASGMMYSDYYFLQKVSY